MPSRTLEDCWPGFRRPKTSTSSVSVGGLDDLPVAGRRKRPVGEVIEVEDSDGEEVDGTFCSSKKRKCSPQVSLPRSREQSLLTDVDSGYFTANENETADSEPRADETADGAVKKYKGTIDLSLAPISNVREMFEDMVKQLCPVSLEKSPCGLNIATLCSGTDAPVFALNLIQDAMQAMGLGAGFEFRHLFSCEIEPFKQGFIRRNLPPGTLIFRDVVEMATAKVQATTAGGSKAAIPRDPLDILFAGCSCVDYSNMNQNKPSGRVPSLDRHLKQESKKSGTRKTAPGSNGTPALGPVAVDELFINDLDRGLDELLQVSAGESARTFFAAIKLITDLRPKLVILENVVGAPWDMYTNQIFPKIGYVAHQLRLDSKDFYLPQTRQRGYLVALDAIHFGEGLARKITAEWETQLLKCKHSPSTSVAAFLQPPDHPATIQARAEMERRSSSSAEWALCSLRHADARQKHGLRRDDNPFSRKAMRNGRIISAAYPSHSWSQFWENQVARVIDLMDIVSAIGNKQGVDLAYKTIMIDASQNVDRNPSSTAGMSVARHLGVVGCITPNGLPIVTDLMRPVTGTETLSLQGLPVDELVISTETQAQLRDLAGNAMTVTVVGAVSLALLLAVSKMAPARLKPIPSAQSRRGQYLEAPQSELLTAGRTTSIAINLDQLMEIAERMVRVCYCPVRANEALVCAACGATACPACCGNPEHDFRRLEVPDSVLSAECGKIYLKDRLPSALVLSVPPSVVRQSLRGGGEELYHRVVQSILTGEPVYYFDEIKVTETVTVCYKATNSIARLVISPKSGCYWYIYIAPWQKYRTQLTGVHDLDHPIARGKITHDFNVPRWSVWVNRRVNLRLQLDPTRAGTLVASNLSFVEDCSAEPDASLLRWKRTLEETVCGVYVHHPTCGGAGRTLRIKQGTTSTSRVFMMWDSAGLRDPRDDHFVWTDNPRRLESHEYRHIYLHANSALRWKAVSGVGPVDVFSPGYWVRSSEASMASMLGETRPIANPARVSWGSAESIQQASCHIPGQSPVAHMPVLANVHATFSQFPISPARVSRFTAYTTSHTLYAVPATGIDAFLRMFAFLSTEIRMSRTPADLAPFSHLRGEFVPVAPCRDCSVTPPEITVYTKEDRKKETRGEKKFTRAIIEDPDKAALFERQYQDLPRAVAVAARLAYHRDGSSTMDMRLMLQPKTLASRALAYLVQAHRTASCGAFALRAEANASFTVTLDYASPPKVGFAPFSASVQPCGRDFNAGIDLARECELPPLGPPRFRRSSKVRYNLRSGQMDAVHWMLQRERRPLDFVKTEIEEEVVAPLNMRIVGKAEWANRFPYSSRGGVVAHEIGYGKTVMTLALLDYMRRFDEIESIAERKEKLDNAWAEELPRPFEHFGYADASCREVDKATFFCHLSATLVIVPKHITDQWADEVHKFLGLEAPRLLVIKTTRAFYEGLDLEQLQQAEIIIVSSAVFGNGFVDRLQTVAGRGTDYPKGLFGRTLESWYRQALSNHRILTARYFAGIASGGSHRNVMTRIWHDLLPALIKKQQAEIDVLVEAQISTIDRKLYKKVARTVDEATSAADARQKKKMRDKGGQDATSAKIKLGAADWNISWLHNCSFARVIWDECSYDDDNNTALFVANAAANAKWLLSGTPKLFGLEQVCKISAAFGLHVARPEPRMMPGLPAVTKGPELDPMSKSEEFHVYSSRVKSVALAHERHSHAQSFVAAYFRANALEPAMEIQFEEHVRPVGMTTFNAIRYHLLNQEVLDAGFDYTALPAHARAEVALSGSELANRDGRSAAIMLMDLLACGLGGDGNSVHVLECDLARRSDALCDQMKLLWDKIMFLWRWILELTPEDAATFKLTQPVQDTLNRVDTMCSNLQRALLGEGAFEEFGGKDIFQREAAVVAGVWKAESRRDFNTDLDLDSLRQSWQSHFPEGWTNQYCRNKALYTWLDFFKAKTSIPDQLTEKQLRLLAKDICWLRYKVDPHAAPLLGNLPDLCFLRDASRTTRSRVIPRKVDAFPVSDSHFLDELTQRELREFIAACIEARPTRQTWQEARGSFKLATHPGKTLKESLQHQLTEQNLKFNAGSSVDKLQEMLWQHEVGLAVCEQYRDGRAPPDTQRDLEQAVSCGGTAAQQAEHANEELKRTFVHLAKTLEDLRATWMEARFVPEYSSLAEADDKDCVVKQKLCNSCQQPLVSAASSFLVVACGHFLCSECKSPTDYCCPVQDCPAFIRERPILRCSQVPRPVVHGLHAKAGRVAALIKNEIPRRDHVLVFAQYRPLIDALAKAFADAGLTCLNLADQSDDNIAKSLEKFKSGRGGQILLLDMDSETSAGSNLTIATHVVFANPYVHCDEEHQARTVRQARGRCIRTGQTEKVHVYHFMVSGTIEEETLRKFGRDSPAVRDFFARSESNPWWLDGVAGGVEVMAGEEVV